MEAECLRNEGSKYYMNGEYTKAIEKYECSASKYKAISLKDWEAKTLCNISLCYLKLNNPERALEVAGKCVQLDSSNAEVSRSRLLHIYHSFVREQCSPM
jgi:tetratricopeptide (TPR) repeat protein